MYYIIGHRRLSENVNNSWYPTRNIFHKKASILRKSSKEALDRRGCGLLLLLVYYYYCCYHRCYNRHCRYYSASYFTITRYYYYYALNYCYHCYCYYRHCSSCHCCHYCFKRISCYFENWPVGLSVCSLLQLSWLLFWVNNAAVRLDCNKTQRPIFEILRYLHVDSWEFLCGLTAYWGIEVGALDNKTRVLDSLSIIYLQRVLVGNEISSWLLVSFNASDGKNT